MRVLGLVLLCAATASAQTHVEGTGTVGVSVDTFGSNSAYSALDVLVERSLESTLAVSAHLVAQVTGSFAFSDLGSSVRIQFRLPSWNTAAIYLELFPFDGRRVRSTFDYANYWGQPVHPTGFAPTVRAGYVRNNISLWGSLRGYQRLDNQALVLALRMIGMLGGGVSLPHGFRSDVILTVAERGDVPELAAQGITLLVVAFGATGRLAWESGGGVLEPVGTALNSSDPDRFARLFAHENYGTSRAAYIGLEGGVASQNLRDPDVFATTRRDTTGYADLQARLRLKSLRLSASLRVQQAAFIVFDVPSFPPFSAFPKGAVTQDQYSGKLGADYRFAGPGLTPGVTIGVGRPAALKNPTSFGLGSRTLVLYREGSFEALPTGAQTLPQFWATASLLFDRFALLSALLVVQYSLDPNASQFNDSNVGNPEPIRITRSFAKVDLLVQFRF